MRIARTTLTSALAIWLWIFVGLIGFLMCVQVLMLVYAPKGTWHLPRIYKVTVREFDQEPQDIYSTIITGKNVRPVPDDVYASDAKDAQGGKDKDEDGDADDSQPNAKAKPGAKAADAKARVDAKDLEQDDPDEFEDRSIALAKSERQGLNVGDSFWVMDNYYRSSLRPPQFRLTPVRLLIEFPEPLLILALILLYQLRKVRAQAEREEQAAPRERVVLRDDFHQRAERFAEPKDKGSDQ